jgi:hypothetical protein
VADEVDRLVDALELADEPVDVGLLGGVEARRHRAAEAGKRGRHDVRALEVTTERVPEAMGVGHAMNEYGRHAAVLRDRHG